MAEEKKGGKKVGVLALAAIVIVGGAVAFKSCNKTDEAPKTDDQKIETPAEPNANPEQTPAPEEAPAQEQAPAPEQTAQA